MRSGNEQLGLAIGNKQVPVLDGVRGFAVLFVVVYHFFPYLLVNGGSILGQTLDSFVMMGWSGVDLFFVLSGFLITGILYKTSARKDYFMNFYSRRVLRIFPLYYLLILIAMFVLPVFIQDPEITGIGTGPFWPYWLYLGNFDQEIAMAANAFLIVTWSLSIEEQYYLVYPAMVRKLNYNTWIRMLLLLIVSSFVLRFVFFFISSSAYIPDGFSFSLLTSGEPYASYSGLFGPSHAYHFTFTHFDGIALGGLLRLLLYKADENQKYISGYLKSMWVLVPLSVLLVLYCGFQLIGPGETRVHSAFHPLMILFGYLINSLVYGGLVLYCLYSSGLFFRFFNSRFMRMTGKYSYAMYLLHFPAGKIGGWILSSSGIDLYSSKGGVLFFALSILLTYLLAIFSWYALEGPMQKLKERFAGH
jgi:peptidoglycan/LPS O-acetylase OafA/YrhL